MTSPRKHGQLSSSRNEKAAGHDGPRDGIGTASGPTGCCESQRSSYPIPSTWLRRIAAVRQPLTTEMGDDMTVTNLEDFKALEPFFRIIEKGLDGLVDGGHFFDLFADDAVIEFVVTVPGYPKRIEGRENLAELYRGYGDTLMLDRCSDLAVYRDSELSVVVLEYAGTGRVVATGRPYP